MHVAIDAHMVGENETGNETYTLNLVRGLLRITQEAGSRDLDPVRLSLLSPHPERLRTRLASLPSHAEIRTLRPGNALLRIPLSLPLTARRHRFDLLHVTYNAPPITPCPTVVTVHDIAFERYPQFFSPRDQAILRTLVPPSIRRAARVITVSQHAKREIMDRYGIPAEKIAVTYEAAADHFKPVVDRSALDAVRERYGTGPSPFVLALGNLQPRKNMARLVEAFSAVAHLPQFDQVKLVVAGKAQWRESDIFEAVEGRGLTDRVIFPGYVDDNDVPALYSAASLFVFPTLYEGFGLPPLEAMACGTPVVCSNAASLPEVVGDAAVQVDPTDTDALAKAMADVLGDPNQANELRERGLERAARFSWDRCAAETLAVYREVMQEREANG
ncbi:MAG: glycosyltransferase family 1 protein [Chloroflexota bacterium]|nr:glycosyltransferase family 1 protein [Chloroflexota bacterium]